MTLPGILRLAIPVAVCLAFTSYAPLAQAADSPGSKEQFLVALSQAAAHTDDATAQRETTALYTWLRSSGLRRVYPGVSGCSSALAEAALFGAGEGALQIGLSSARPDPEVVARSKKSFAEFVALCPAEAKKGKAFVDDIGAVLIPVREKKIVRGEQERKAKEEFDRRAKEDSEKRADELAAAIRAEADQKRRQADQARAEEAGRAEAEIRRRLLARRQVPVTLGQDGRASIDGTVARNETAYYTVPALKGQRVSIRLESPIEETTFRVFRESQIAQIQSRTPVANRVLESTRDGAFTVDEDGAYLIAVTARKEQAAFRLEAAIEGSPAAVPLLAQLYGAWRCPITIDSKVVLRYGLDGTRMAHVTSSQSELMEYAKVGEFDGMHYVEERRAQNWLKSPKEAQAPGWRATTFDPDPYVSTHAFFEFEVSEVTAQTLVIRNLSVSNSNRADKRPRTPPPLNCVRLPMREANYLEEARRLMPAELL